MKPSLPRNITEEQYEKHYGHPPTDDDLERVNCKTVGRVLHSQCGWCDKHNAPRFACGCLVLREEMP